MRECFGEQKEVFHQIHSLLLIKNTVLERVLLEFTDFKYSPILLPELHEHFSFLITFWERVSWELAEVLQH